MYFAFSSLSPPPGGESTPWVPPGSLITRSPFRRPKGRSPKHKEVVHEHPAHPQSIAAGGTEANAAYKGLSNLSVPLHSAALMPHHAVTSAMSPTLGRGGVALSCLVSTQPQAVCPRGPWGATGATGAISHTSVPRMARSCHNNFKGFRCKSTDTESQRMRCPGRYPKSPLGQLAEL